MGLGKRGEGGVDRGGVAMDDVCGRGKASASGGVPGGPVAGSDVVDSSGAEGNREDDEDVACGKLGSGSCNSFIEADVADGGEGSVETAGEGMGC